MSTLSAIAVAGTHSGVGKTTVTLGLIAALRRRGSVVQPFKVGPDFIDPLHHAHAAGRPSRNLDGWMLTPDANRTCWSRATADADVAVVEGVMGLFDGSEGGSDRGSTAEMAKLLGIPVVLVIDASAMARSAAALIHGFITFDPAVRVAGVILNRVGGPGHTAIIREAAAASIPILGALPWVPDLALPERHLGLHLPHEAQAGYVEHAADLIQANVDLDALLHTTRIQRRPADAVPEPTPTRARIALARDEAFCFYYDDNLELLERAGAELVPFSPIREGLPADVDGVYIGGGYPELHATALSDNDAAKRAIRTLAAAGAPVYGECGGLMYLAERMKVGGEVFPMCGVLPFGTRIPAGLALSYVEIHTRAGLFGSGRTVRGHMYHHSVIDGEAPGDRCYDVRTPRGDASEEGYHDGNVLASYAHLHFASDPAIASAFVTACEAFRTGRDPPRRAEQPGALKP